MRVVFVASFAFVCALSFVVVACGGGSSSTQAPSSTEAGVEASTTLEAGVAEATVEAAPYPAIVPTDVPQVISGGGPVMALPKVIPIFYTSDDPTMTASIQDFVTKLGASDYWPGAVAEYGVGQVVGEPAIQLPADEDPPTTYDDSDIETWLANEIQSGAPGFTTPDANTIYTFFFPAGVTITEGGHSSGWPDGEAPEGGGAGGGGGAPFATSCVQFGGFHSNIQLDAAHGNALIAYAVVPRCSNFDGFTGIDAVTAAASHEIVEASTDPFPNSPAPGYVTTDVAHAYWATLLTGSPGTCEIGDMCAYNVPGSFVKFPDLPYLVQRIWSNKAALAGTDPCTPVPAGEVYFNSMPVLPNSQKTTEYLPDGGTVPLEMHYVKIPVGSSASVNVDLFSAAATSSPWLVQAADEYDLEYVSSQQLEFKFAPQQGQNGSTISMTIKVIAAGAGNQEPFLLFSTLKDGTQQLWAGVVQQ